MSFCGKHEIGNVSCISVECSEFVTRTMYPGV